MRTRLVLAIAIFCHSNICWSQSFDTGIGFSSDIGIILRKNVGHSQIGVGVSFEENRYLHDQFSLTVKYYDLSMYYRYYFMQHNGLRKFCEIEGVVGYGELQRTYEYPDLSGESQYRDRYGLAAYAGLEYMISHNLGIEGKLGLSYFRVSEFNDFDSFSTVKLNPVVAVNYYW